MDSNPSGTFCLAAGTYTVPQTITAQSDKIVGAGRDQTFIVGTGALNIFTAASGSVWSLRKLDISGGVGNADCAPDCGRAFVGAGEKLTLKKIHCHDNDNQCVGSGSADLSFVKSECDHNGTPLFASLTDVRSTACIKRIRGGSSDIHTVVRLSDIHDNLWEGVWFDYYEGTAVIKGNTITGNGKAGIGWEVSGGFNAADNLIVRGNTITGNGHAGLHPIDGGILCNTCADLLVEANTFGNNEQGAVRFISSSREWGRIYGVTITENDLNGDALSCPSGAACSGNA